jgi:uridine kinase
LHMGRSPFVIGIAGGSGSGKSTLAAALIERLGTDRTLLLSHDAYYRGAPAGTDPARINYDHPDSLDTALCAEHLRKLFSGESVSVPVYDFNTHARTGATTVLATAPYIIVEGILVLAESALRAQMHLRVFVYAHEELRFNRRLQRDVAERGRSHESVLLQWEQTVIPMHERYVGPSKEYAHVIIDGGEINDAAVRDLAEMVRSLARLR